MGQAAARPSHANCPPPQRARPALAAVGGRTAAAPLALRNPGFSRTPSVLAGMRGGRSVPSVPAFSFLSSGLGPVAVCRTRSPCCPANSCLPWELLPPGFRHFDLSQRRGGSPLGTHTRRGEWCQGLRLISCLAFARRLSHRALPQGHLLSSSPCSTALPALRVCGEVQSLAPLLGGGRRRLNTRQRSLQGHVLSAVSRDSSPGVPLLPRAVEHLRGAVVCCLLPKARFSLNSRSSTPGG